MVMSCSKSGASSDAVGLVSDDSVPCCEALRGDRLVSTIQHVSYDAPLYVEYADELEAAAKRARTGEPAQVLTCEKRDRPMKMVRSLIAVVNKVRSISEPT